MLMTPNRKTDQFIRLATFIDGLAGQSKMLCHPLNCVKSARRIEQLTARYNNAGTGSLYRFDYRCQAWPFARFRYTKQPPCHWRPLQMVALPCALSVSNERPVNPSAR